MAGQQQQDQQGVSPFPTPPLLFYKQYTEEKVKLGQAPKPPAPVKGEYTMFGAPFNVNSYLINHTVLYAGAGWILGASGSGEQILP